MYGLISKKHLKEIIDDVVNVLGNGKNNTADDLLWETAAAETDLGDAIDNTWSTGVGLFQFDPVAFNDVKERTPKHIKDLIREHWGIDLDRATINDLRWSPLVSTIFARLKYRLIPEEIPTTIEERAEYWKKYYNSQLGAGTVEHYIRSAIRAHRILNNINPREAIA